LRLVSGSQQHLPKYFYAGNLTLQDLEGRGGGERVTELLDEEVDLYCFYDMPMELMMPSNFDVQLSDSVYVAGNKIITFPSYSPEYFLTSLDKGFHFCQSVSDFIGANSTNKEYSAKECQDAANGTFYKEMHPDILAYAVDFYL
jgi:hypothetical protein